MKAIEYVKKNGIEKSKIHLDRMKQERWINSFFNDLKQIVDAFELVEKYKNRHGGIRFRIRWGMYRYGDTQEFNDRLKQAINLVEQCR